MKKTYDDYYAQVRKVSGDRKIVYFWINNLLKEDFVKLENGNYSREEGGSRKKRSKPGASGTKQDEGDGSGIMLRDRLRKLMADWGSHPAAPSVNEGMEDERL